MNYKDIPIHTMNEDPVVYIEKSITLNSLLERWKAFEIGGTPMNREGIQMLKDEFKITPYDKYIDVLDNKLGEFLGKKRNPYLGLIPNAWQTDSDIIFDLEEVERIERKASEIAKKNLSYPSSQPFAHLSITSHDSLRQIQSYSESEIREILLNYSKQLNSEIEPTKQESKKMNLMFLQWGKGNCELMYPSHRGQDNQRSPLSPV